MTAILADRNRVTGRGTWTDVGGTWATTPPLANLGTPETPEPSAEFTGQQAEFSFAALDEADAAETFEVQVLALLDHELPEGALIEWRRADGSLIAAKTWRRFGLRKKRSYIILPAPLQLDAIHCKISGVASGTYRVGAAYAGRLGFRERVERGWEREGNDTTSVATAGTTDWASAAARRVGQQVTIPRVTYDKALGVPLPGSNLPVPAAWDTNNSTSEADGVYTFTGVSTSPLLAKTSALTAGEWHRITVELTQDTANTAIVSADLGSDGPQALQPGENTIVAKATDASLAFTTGAAFTGTLELKKIEQLATGITEEDLQSRLDESGQAEPVIYFPRTDNMQWIQSTAIYGRLASPGRITHTRGPYHDVTFRIIEQG